MNVLWDKIFTPKTDGEESAFHCTVKGLMQISKMTKIEAVHYLREHGTPLEHEGWYEVILKGSKT